MPTSSILSTLRDVAGMESAAIESQFAASGDGAAALQACTALADRLVLALYGDSFSEQFGGTVARAGNLCVVALGGYGRRELYPHSDIDLLFLCSSRRSEAAVKEPAAAVARHLWDLGWRTSITSRTLEECERFEPGNPEFTLSLLDCRYLAGDSGLYTDLRDGVVPGLASQEYGPLIRSITEMTEARHARFGHTIYHLEPNLKDGPGGLRDLHVADWVELLSELSRHRRWPARDSSGGEAAAAFAFYSAARVFLHYRCHRDDNRFTWDLQDEAAGHAIGCSQGDLLSGRGPGQPLEAKDWMRIYFRHARNIFTLSGRRLEQAVAARPTLYALYRDWRSRLANAEFYVVRGRVIARRPAGLEDPSAVLGLFEFMARHGVEPSEDAESAIRRCALRLENSGEASSSALNPWPQVRRILLHPHAAAALRSMHRLGILDALFPEFRAIHTLVIRDLYHRYTVDEHTMLTIENIHALQGAILDPECRFAEILSELEQPELLYLSLLFHDVGKGLSAEDHVAASLGAVDGVLERLQLGEEQREIVRFLIRQHLEMSATLQRRDISDTETARAFAESIGSRERLKLLCLFTYADIKSVNPEALTPWKAEMLWTLYAAAANSMTRSLDDVRLTAAADRARIEQIASSLEGKVKLDELTAFLDGFPRRYVDAQQPAAICSHVFSARRLGESAVQLLLDRHGHSTELTVITRDRPRLFSMLSGALAGWGMNILKADAFANRAGIVVDTFRFADPFRTLELNAIEGERFLASLREIVTGTASLELLLRGRLRRNPGLRQSMQISPEVRFDNNYSSHSTVLEIVARDRSGLLYEISSVLADAGCNIEAALIDTQGEKAIDVFYLTMQGHKLDDALQDTLRESLICSLELP
ncbi:MAG: ACT domain-containing protein [Acidipila sp.]|nr:ACT domain-containing protein [Acidipila sp.]